jgi:two-component system cell cycle response regulator CtrA
MTRILLVENNTAMAVTIEQTLHSENFIVERTDLGEDAIQIGKLYDYDVIILALILPDIDGLEVLRRLRAVPRPEEVDQFDRTRRGLERRGQH